MDEKEKTVSQKAQESQEEILTVGSDKSTPEDTNGAVSESTGADTSEGADDAVTGNIEPEVPERELELESMPIVIDDEFDANSEEYIAELESMRSNLAANIEEQPRYQRPKLPFREAVDNFIYHNKTKLTVIAVVLIMAAIIIYQSIPEKYDYTFLIFSSNYYFDDQSLMEIGDNLEKYGEDLDGDGEVKVHVLRYNTNSNDYNEALVSRVYMAEEFRTQHEAYLVLTDKAHYDVLTDEEEGFGGNLFESHDGMDKWIDATDSGLFVQTNGAYNIIEGDDRIGMSLVALNDNTSNDEKYVKRYNDAKAMLERILEDNPEIKAEN